MCPNLFFFTTVWLIIQIVNEKFFAGLFLSKPISTPSRVNTNTVRCTKELNVMHNKGSKKVVHEQAKSKENRDKSKNRHGSKLITCLYT